jgi:hypothetical protein
LKQSTLFSKWSAHNSDTFSQKNNSKKKLRQLTFPESRAIAHKKLQKDIDNPPEQQKPNPCSLKFNMENQSNESSNGAKWKFAERVNHSPDRLLATPDLHIHVYQRPKNQIKNRNSSKNFYF